MWRDEGSKKVALEADSLDELRELINQAKKLDLVNAMIQDAGYTEVAPGTVTCIGIGPDQSQKVDRVTGRLPLL
jgi:PTH2 family peptidyl-tRNA hydrolase